MAIIDCQVRIVPNNGWSSFTYVKKNIERLYQYWNVKYAEKESVLEDKKTYPHIWVFTWRLLPMGEKWIFNLQKNSWITSGNDLKRQ